MNNTNARKVKSQYRDVSHDAVFKKVFLTAKDTIKSSEKLDQITWAVQSIKQWLLDGRQESIEEALDFLANRQDSIREIIVWFRQVIQSDFDERYSAKIQSLWTNVIIKDALPTLRVTAHMLISLKNRHLNRVQVWLVEEQLFHRKTIVEDIMNAAVRTLFEIGKLAIIPEDKLLAAWTYYQTGIFRDIALGYDNISHINNNSNSIYNPSGQSIKNPDNTIQKAYVINACGEGQVAIDIGQKALAYSIQYVLDGYVNSKSMSVDWLSKSASSERLQEGFQWQLASWFCLNMLFQEQSGNPETDQRCSQIPLLALARLGLARTNNMLDYVQTWPDSLGAILDVREYLNLPDAKQHVAHSFIQQLSDRVLHAGATTAEILSIYVAMIKVFKTLDNRSVLLEKVAQPVRNFLRERADTGKVIATSLLAELDQRNDLIQHGGLPTLDDVCLEITREVSLSESATSIMTKKETNLLDFDDMNWLPDPIDAGPDYRSNKTNDVISYMLTLFEKDTFIKEVQNTLGERLLASSLLQHSTIDNSSPLTQELRLVEMLKSRLGAEKLQAAEVMVKDMSDSARIATLIDAQQARQRQSRQSRVRNGPSTRDVYLCIPENGSISLGDLMDRLGDRMPRDQNNRDEFVQRVRRAAVPERPLRRGGSPLLKRRIDAEFSDDDGGKDDEKRNNDNIMNNDNVQYNDSNECILEAKILSSFFWPELRDDDFKIPPGIVERMQGYEKNFTKIKTRRKLKWLSALGRADVEIELKDRTVKVEGCKTWILSVISAFQQQPHASGDDNMDVKDDELISGEAITKSVDELEMELNMDEALVRNAVVFWVNKGVLRQTEPDVYQIIEVEGSEEEHRDNEPPGEPINTAVSIIKSQDTLLKDNKFLYCSFIVGMLSNNGAMDAGKVAMMLKLVFDGGFDYGDEGATWLLESMEVEGQVERRGDIWSIKK